MKVRLQILTLLIFTVNGVLADEKVRIINSISSKRLIWRKIATICMRRDVAITYKVRYNAGRACCPKMLFYTDQQYQRILYLKALDIMKDESARKKRKERSKRSIIASYPGSFAENIRFSKDEFRSYNNGKMSKGYISVDHIHNQDKITRNPSENIDHGMSFNGFSPKSPRLKRSISDHELTYKRIIDDMYFKGTSLLKRAEKRIKNVYSCAEASKSLTHVLDTSQVIKLCPNSGIAIGPDTNTMKMCTGTIKPIDQVFLPNLTEVQSWYGSSENPDGNPELETWKENTWHIVLLNCPGSPPLNISYVIDFDVINNLGKNISEQERPNLQDVCQTIVLPPYTEIDGIPKGGSSSPHTIYLSSIFCYIFIFYMLNGVF